AGSVLLALSIALGNWRRGNAEAPAPRGNAVATAPASVASISCSSAACHGANAAPGKGGEYNVWIDRDPHVRAYDSLFTERSRKMVERLGEKPAHENRLCLSCHAAPGAAENPELATETAGTGCTSCHGAGEWETAHYRADWWQSDEKTKR